MANKRKLLLALPTLVGVFSSVASTDQATVALSALRTKATVGQSEENERKDSLAQLIAKKSLLDYQQELNLHGTADLTDVIKTQLKLADLKGYSEDELKPVVMRRPETIQEFANYHFDGNVGYNYTGYLQLLAVERLASDLNNIYDSLKITEEEAKNLIGNLSLPTNKLDLTNFQGTKRKFQSVIEKLLDGSLTLESIEKSILKLREVEAKEEKLSYWEQRSIRTEAEFIVTTVEDVREEAGVEKSTAAAVTNLSLLNNEVEATLNENMFKLVNVEKFNNVAATLGWTTDELDYILSSNDLQRPKRLENIFLTFEGVSVDKYDENDASTWALTKWLRDTFNALVQDEIDTVDMQGYTLEEIVDRFVEDVIPQSPSDLEIFATRNEFSRTAVSVATITNTNVTLRTAVARSLATDITTAETNAGVTAKQANFWTQVAGKPASAAELTNYLGTGKTYQAWLTDKLNAFNTAKQTQITNANKQGYTMAQLFPSGLPYEPEIESELIAYSGPIGNKISLQAYIEARALGQFRVDLALAEHPWTSADIETIFKSTHAPTPISGSMDKPTTPGEINAFWNDGTNTRSYQDWLFHVAMLEAEDNTLKYGTAEIVALDNTKTAPTNAQEFIEFEANGLAFTSYSAWLKAKSLEHHNLEIQRTYMDLGWTLSDVQYINAFNGATMPKDKVELRDSINATTGGPATAGNHSTYAWSIWLAAQWSDLYNKLTADFAPHHPGYTIAQLMTELNTNVQTAVTYALPTDRKNYQRYATLNGQMQSFEQAMLIAAQSLIKNDVAAEEALTTGSTALIQEITFFTGKPISPGQIANWKGGLSYKDWLDIEIAKFTAHLQAIENNADKLGYTLAEILPDGMGGHSIPRYPTSYWALANYVDDSGNPIALIDYIHEKAVAKLSNDILTLEAGFEFAELEAMFRNNASLNPISGVLAKPKNKGELTKFYNDGTDKTYLEYLLLNLAKLAETDNRTRDVDVAYMLTQRGETAPTTGAGYTQYKQDTSGKWLTLTEWYIQEANAHFEEEVEAIKNDFGWTDADMAAMHTIAGVAAPTTIPEIKDAFDGSNSAGFAQGTYNTYAYHVWLTKEFNAATTAEFNAATSLNYTDVQIRTFISTEHMSGTALPLPTKPSELTAFTNIGGTARSYQDTITHFAALLLAFELDGIATALSWTVAELQWLAAEASVAMPANATEMRTLYNGTADLTFVDGTYSTYAFYNWALNVQFVASVAASEASATLLEYTPAEVRAHIGNDIESLGAAKDAPTRPSELSTMYTNNGSVTRTYEDSLTFYANSKLIKDTNDVIAAAGTNATFVAEITKYLTMPRVKSEIFTNFSATGMTFAAYIAGELVIFNQRVADIKAAADLKGSTLATLFPAGNPLVDPISYSEIAKYKAISGSMVSFKLYIENVAINYLASQILLAEDGYTLIDIENAIEYVDATLAPISGEVRKPNSLTEVGKFYNDGTKDYTYREWLNLKTIAYADSIANRLGFGINELVTFDSVTLPTGPAQYYGFTTDSSGNSVSYIKWQEEAAVRFLAHELEEVRKTLTDGTNTWSPAEVTWMLTQASLAAPKNAEELRKTFDGDTQTAPAPGNHTAYIYKKWLEDRLQTVHVANAYTNSTHLDYTAVELREHMGKVLDSTLNARPLPWRPNEITTDYSTYETVARGYEDSLTYAATKLLEHEYEKVALASGWTVAELDWLITDAGVTKPANSAQMRTLFNGVSDSTLVAGTFTTYALYEWAQQQLATVITREGTNANKKGYTVTETIDHLNAEVHKLFALTAPIRPNQITGTYATIGGNTLTYKQTLEHAAAEFVKFELDGVAAILGWEGAEVQWLAQRNGQPIPDSKDAIRNNYAGTAGAPAIAADYATYAFSIWLGTATFASVEIPLAEATATKLEYSVAQIIDYVNAEHAPTQGTLVTPVRPKQIYDEYSEVAGTKRTYEETLTWGAAQYLTHEIQKVADELSWSVAELQWLASETGVAMPANADEMRTLYNGTADLTYVKHDFDTYAFYNWALNTRFLGVEIPKAETNATKLGYTITELLEYLGKIEDGGTTNRPKPIRPDEIRTQYTNYGGTVRTYEESLTFAATKLWAMEIAAIDTSLGWTHAETQWLVATAGKTFPTSGAQLKHLYEGTASSGYTFNDASTYGFRIWLQAQFDAHMAKAEADYVDKGYTVSDALNHGGITLAGGSVGLAKPVRPNEWISFYPDPNNAGSHLGYEASLTWLANDTLRHDIATSISTAGASQDQVDEFTYFTGMPVNKSNVRTDFRGLGYNFETFLSNQLKALRDYIADIKANADKNGYGLTTIFPATNPLVDPTTWQQIQEYSTYPDGQPMSFKAYIESNAQSVFSKEILKAEDGWKLLEVEDFLNYQTAGVALEPNNGFAKPADNAQLNGFFTDAALNLKSYKEWLLLQSIVFSETHTDNNRFGYDISELLTHFSVTKPSTPTEWYEFYTDPKTGKKYTYFEFQQYAGELYLEFEWQEILKDLNWKEQDAIDMLNHNGDAKPTTMNETRNAFSGFTNTAGYAPAEWAKYSLHKYFVKHFNDIYDAASDPAVVFYREYSKAEVLTHLGTEVAGGSVAYPAPTTLSQVNTYYDFDGDGVKESYTETLNWAAREKLLFDADADLRAVGATRAQAEEWTSLFAPLEVKSDITNFHGTGTYRQFIQDEFDAFNAMITNQKANANKLGFTLLELFPTANPLVDPELYADARAFKEVGGIVFSFSQYIELIAASHLTRLISVEEEKGWDLLEIEAILDDSTAPMPDTGVRGRPKNRSEMQSYWTDADGNVLTYKQYLMHVKVSQLEANYDFLDYDRQEFYDHFGVAYPTDGDKFKEFMLHPDTSAKMSYKDFLEYAPTTYMEFDREKAYLETGFTVAEVQWLINNASLTEPKREKEIRDTFDSVTVAGVDKDFKTYAVTIWATTEFNRLKTEHETNATLLDYTNFEVRDYIGKIINAAGATHALPDSPNDLLVYQNNGIRDLTYGQALTFYADDFLKYETKELFDALGWTRSDYNIVMTHLSAAEPTNATEMRTAYGTFTGTPTPGNYSDYAFYKYLDSQFNILMTQARSNYVLLGYGEGEVVGHINAEVQPGSTYAVPTKPSQIIEFMTETSGTILSFEAAMTKYAATKLAFDITTIERALDTKGWVLGVDILPGVAKPREKSEVFTDYFDGTNQTSDTYKAFLEAKVQTILDAAINAALATETWDRQDALAMATINGTKNFPENKAELEIDFASSGLSFIQYLKQTFGGAVAGVVPPLGYQLATVVDRADWPTRPKQLADYHGDATNVTWTTYVTTKEKAYHDTLVAEAESNTNIAIVDTIPTFVADRLTHAGKTRPANKAEYEDFDGLGTDYPTWLRREMLAAGHYNTLGFTKQEVINLAASHSETLRDIVNDVPVNTTNDYLVSYGVNPLGVTVGYVEYVSSWAAFVLEQEIVKIEGTTLGWLPTDVNYILGQESVTTKPQNKTELENNFQASSKGYEAWLKEKFTAQVTTHEVNADLIGYPLTQIQTLVPAPTSPSTLQVYSTSGGNKTYQEALEAAAKKQLADDYNAKVLGADKVGYTAEVAAHLLTITAVSHYNHVFTNYNGSLKPLETYVEDYAAALLEADKQQVLTALSWNQGDITSLEAISGTTIWATVSEKAHIGLYPATSNTSNLNFQDFISALFNKEITDAQTNATRLGYSPAEIIAHSTLSVPGKPGELEKYRDINSDGIKDTYEDAISHFAIVKLNADIATAEIATGFTSAGVRHLLTQASSGKPTNKAELADFKGSSLSYTDWLIDQFQKQKADIETTKANLLGYSLLAEVLGGDNTKLPVKPIELQVYPHHGSNLSYKDALEQLALIKLNADIATAETNSGFTQIGISALLNGISKPANKSQVGTDFNSSSLTYEAWLTQTFTTKRQAIEAATDKLGYTVPEVVARLSNGRPTQVEWLTDYNSTGKTYAEEIEEAAQKLLNNDIAAELAASVPTWSAAEVVTVLNGKSQPANKAEISNFDSSGLSYGAWLLQQFNQQVADIQTTQANLREYDWTTEVLPGINAINGIPTKPSHLTDYRQDGTFVTYKAQIETVSLSLLNAHIARERAAHISTWTNADYSFILGSNAAPAKKSEVENYKGVNKTFGEWLVDEVLVKRANIEQTRSDKLGYDFATDILPTLTSSYTGQPTTPTGLQVYVTGKSYQDVIEEIAADKLAADIAAQEATLTGWTQADVVAMLNGTPKPANKAELSNFAGSGSTYAAWLQAQFIAALTVVEQTTANLKKYDYGTEIAPRVTTNASGRPTIPSQISDYNRTPGTPVSYQSILEKEATDLLAEQITTAETKSGLTAQEIIDKTKSTGKPKDKDQLHTDFAGTGLTYEDYLQSGTNVVVSAIDFLADTKGFDTIAILTSLGLSVPTTTAELNDFDGKGNTYRQVIEAEAATMLADLITAQETLLGWTTAEINNMLDSDADGTADIAKPGHRDEVLIDFNSSGKSYRAWLNAELAKRVTALEATMTLLGFDLTNQALVGVFSHANTTGARPTRPSELTSYGSTNGTYVAVINAVATNLLATGIAAAEAATGWTAAEILQVVDKDADGNPDSAKPANRGELYNDYLSSTANYQAWLLAEFTGMISTTEFNADLKGFDLVSEVLPFGDATGARPTSPSELIDYGTNAATQTYKEVLEINGLALLNKGISDAEVASNLAAADITFLLATEGVVKPRTKQELADFAGSGKSYAVWLGERSNNGGTPGAPFAPALQVEANADLLGYTVIEVQTNTNLTNPIVRPSDLAGLQDYQSTGKTYEKVLEESAADLLATDIQKAHTNLSYDASDITTLMGTNTAPANKSEVRTNFAGSGKSYQAWLLEKFASLLATEIAKVNLKGYDWTADVLVMFNSRHTSGLPARPAHLNDVDRDASNVKLVDALTDSVKALIARDIKAELDTHTPTWNQVADITAMNTLMTVTKPDSKSTINTDYNNSGKSYGKWMIDTFNTLVAQHETSADLHGYNFTTDLKPLLPNVTTPSILANADGTNRYTYKQLIEVEADALLAADVRNQEVTHVGTWSPAEITTVLGGTPKPATKQEVLNFVFSNLSYGAWLANELNNIIRIDQQSADLHGYDLTTEILTQVTQAAPTRPSDLTNYDGLGASYKAVLEATADTVLAAAIAAAEAAVGYNQVEVTALLNGRPKPTKKSEVSTNFDNSGKTYQAWLTDAFTLTLSEIETEPTNLLGYDFATEITPKLPNGRPTTPTGLGDYFLDGTNFTYAVNVKATAQGLLNADIAAAEAANSYDAADIAILLGSIAKPANKSEVTTNFNSSNKSYEVWLGERFAQLLTQTELTLTLRGYDLSSEVLNGVAKPATPKELNAFNSTTQTYVQWVSAKSKALLDADIQAAHDAILNAPNGSAVQITTAELNSAVAQGGTAPATKQEVALRYKQEGSTWYSYEQFLVREISKARLSGLNYKGYTSTEIIEFGENVVGSLSLPTKVEDIYDYNNSGKSLETSYSEIVDLKIEHDYVEIERLFNIPESIMINFILKDTSNVPLARPDSKGKIFTNFSGGKDYETFIRDRFRLYVDSLISDDIKNGYGVGELGSGYPSDWNEFVGTGTDSDPAFVEIIEQSAGEKLVGDYTQILNEFHFGFADEEKEKKYENNKPLLVGIGMPGSKQEIYQDYLEASTSTNKSFGEYLFDVFVKRTNHPNSTAIAPTDLEDLGEYLGYELSDLFTIVAKDGTVILGGASRTPSANIGLMSLNTLVKAQLVRPDTYAEFKAYNGTQFTYLDQAEKVANGLHSDLTEAEVGLSDVKELSAARSILKTAGLEFPKTKQELFNDFNGTNKSFQLWLNEMKASGGGDNTTTPGQDQIITQTSSSLNIIFLLIGLGGLAAGLAFFFLGGKTGDDEEKKRLKEMKALQEKQEKEAKAAEKSAPKEEPKKEEPKKEEPKKEEPKKEEPAKKGGDK